MSAPRPEPDRAPHVVQVIGALAAGGAERFVVDLSLALAQRGVRVSMHTLSPRRDALGERMATALAAAGIEVRSGPTERVRIRSVIAYAQSLRRLRPQVVHLHNVNAESAHFLVRRFLSFPYVGVRTVHSSRIAMSPLVRRGFARNPVGSTVFCSQAALEANRGRFRGEVRTIENGIRFDWPIRDDAEATNARTRLGLSGAGLHFLCVGRIMGSSLAEAPKAHDVTVAAWKRSRLGSRGATLHLVGDGNLRGELEARAAGDPSIRFHGVRSDVHEWLLACDCFLMPSRWEGLPIAAVEAIGTGLPCIFSRIPPLENLRAPESRYCEPSDPESLSNALVEFADAPRYPATAAVEAARRHFSIDGTAAAYVDVYERLLSRVERQQGTRCACW